MNKILIYSILFYLNIYFRITLKNLWKLVATLFYWLHLGFVWCQGVPGCPQKGYTGALNECDVP